MKKYLVMFLLVSGLCFADKQITLNQLSGLYGRVLFNTNQSQTDTPEYYAITIQFGAKASDGGQIQLACQTIMNVGQPRLTPYTPKEIYDLLKTVNPALANKLKELYLEAINEDLST